MTDEVTLADKQLCPCGYRGCVSSEAPPFWEVDGQVWHWDCLIAAHPEKRDALEAAKEEALARGKYVVWCGRLLLDGQKP